MSDRIPGSSYDNPIWHGRWRIYVSDADWTGHAFAYVHDDYDGAEDANDNRGGYAASVEEAVAEIEDYFPETPKAEAA